MPRQSRNKTIKTRRSPKESKTRYSRRMEFPQASGRTVAMVELNLDSDFHCISIRFQDDADLTFVIDPALTFRADYSEWKAGNQKILKRWPAMQRVGT